jgi:hypothetical protein
MSSGKTHLLCWAQLTELVSITGDKHDVSETGKCLRLQVKICLLCWAQLTELVSITGDKHDVSKTEICLRLQVTTHLLCWSKLTKVLSISGDNSANWAQQSRRVLYLMTETDSSLRNVVF